MPPGCQVAPEWHYIFRKKSISIKPWFAPGVWGVDGFETPAETWRSFLTTQIFPPIWRFFIHKWFSHRVFVFSTCWSNYCPWRKKLEHLKDWWSGSCRECPWKLDPTEELVCAYCADPKVFSGRLRQSGLPKAPWLKTVCVFRCGHQWVARLKKRRLVSLSNNGRASNQHYLIHFNSGLWFWHGTTHKSCC